MDINAAIISRKFFKYLVTLLNNQARNHFARLATRASCEFHIEIDILTMNKAKNLSDSRAQLVETQYIILFNN